MRAATTLLLAILMLPTASAGWFARDEPLTITVAPSRAGDLLQYEEDAEHTTWETLPDGTQVEHRRNVTWTYVVHVEGAARAVDKYGIERDTVAYRIDQKEGSALRASERCHALQGGTQVVRRDVLHGDVSTFGGGASQAWVGPVEVGRSRTSVEHQLLSTWWDWSCRGQNLLPERTFREGETVPLETFLTEAAGVGVASRPAQATTFHGHPALLLTYDVPVMEGYVLELTLADGLPDVVRRIGHAPGVERPQRLELVGIEPGTGPALPTPSGATLPPVNPSAKLRPSDPLAFDDAAWGLDYRFADAVAALRLDPRVGLAEWLAAHPEAHLSVAWYAEQEQPGTAGVPRRTAMWYVVYAHEGQAFHAASIRSIGVAGLLPGVPAAVENWGGPGEYSPPTTPELPPRVPDSATLAALARSQGVDPAGVTQLAYSVWAMEGRTTGILFAESATSSSGGRTEARGVYVDALAAGLGALTTSETVTTTEGLLAPPGSGGLEQDERVSTLSALAGPGVGVGLGVGAATGLALLVVAAKFLLFPLFTRLLRARLLDNPVRARLYERVRAEPGIRQAEVVDYLGVGEGAARHHLAQLVRHRFVVESREGAVPTYYAAGEVPPEVARRAAVLRSASARRVYDAYAAAPGMTLREAAASLGMSAPSVHRQKRKLEAAGLLPAAPLASASP